MKLHYKRSGGFANITTRTDLDLSTIPQSEAKQIRKLVDHARKLKTPSKPNFPVPDDFHHDLEIEESGIKMRIRRSDSECDPELLKLFDHLQKKAR